MGIRGRLMLLQLLLAGLALSGCHGYKPLLQPNVPELRLNEGESLEITCTSINDINVFYPEDDEIANITTSEHEIIPEEENPSSSVKIKFRRRSVVFGDTGWYGCADAKVPVKNRDYNDPNASWTYVYVRSNESAFVQAGEVHSVFGVVGDSVILPCRPTSPELHVELKLNSRTVEPGENLSFDPKTGFTLKNLSAKDSGFFSCEVEQDDFSAEINFIVKVIQKDSMKAPVILKDGLQHVTEGSSLHVKCTVNIGTDNNYVFYWTTPRNSTSRKILPPTRRKVEANTYLVTSELVEDNVTYDDEGEYVCQVKSLIDIKNTSVYIHVYDPSIKYINLTSHDDNRHYILNAFKPVTFSASIDAYPTPTLTWFSPSGKEMTSTNKIAIDSSKTGTTLKIKSVHLEDMGTYVLQADNDDKVERLNFTLEVLVKPWVMMAPVKAYYALNENVQFFCEVVGNPMSNVAWSYTKCPRLPSMEDCEELELKDTEIVGQSGVNVRVAANTTVNMSGKINCTACNFYGCDSALQDILVSDGVTDAAFGIIEPEETLTIGDNLTVICAASVYNFTSVMWLNRNDEPLENSSRTIITFEQTDFTHRSVLYINNLERLDEGVYNCRALTNDYHPDTIRYELTLADPQMPYFTNVNMNGSEVTISARESHNSMHLLCYVKGMPKPIISWYKDGEPLKIIKHQFALVSDDQELAISYLMEKDSGEYSCKAENRFGKIRQSQKFIVKGLEISLVWIVVVGSLILILTILLIYFCIRVRREKKIRKQLLEAGLMHFEEGALDCINPELTVDDQAELLPYDRKWEFPREKLKLGKQLGSGAFGVVMKAQAWGICPDETVTTVAVKSVRRNAEPAYIRALASELKIMVHLGKHLNVVNLLGACTNNIAKRELLVIVEFCRYGNLHNYLLRHRENFINQIDPSTGTIDPSIGRELLMRSTSVGSSKRVKYAALSFSRSLSRASYNSGADTTAPGAETVVYYADTQDVDGLPESCINSNGSQPGWRSNYRGDYKDRNLKPICSQDLLSWAFQVARGMEYLCQRKVLHGDLAARNILLAENNVVKICDFGLAKTMYKDDNYKKQGNGPVPIKWMAIESIRDRVFSTQSDIWSFGIVLWEFFTLAETPYPGMEAEMQYQKLIEGYRMEQPKYATKDIYDIMLSCWKANPTIRPSFTELVDSIGELLEDGVKMHYVELNSPYLDMNTVGLDGKNDYLTMMSAPDHTTFVSTQHHYINSTPQPADSAYLSMNNGSPIDESGIFSPRPTSTQESRFQFSDKTSQNIAHSDGEESPMLKTPKPEPEQDDDNYLKPIDVHKKREQFMKQREAEKRKEQEQAGRASTDRDSGYCNAPNNLELVDARVQAKMNQRWPATDETDKGSLKAQDNYVNMPQQKEERRNAVPSSFMNPSYIFVETGKAESNRRIL